MSITALFFNLECLELEPLLSFAYHSVCTQFYILLCIFISVSVTSPPPAPASTQPDELTNVLEICNIVFTSMFTLEMILKLTAFGFFEYLRNPYNIFDGIIVIIRSAIYIIDLLIVKLGCHLGCQTVPKAENPEIRSLKSLID